MATRAPSPDDARPSDSCFLSPFQGLTSTRELQPNGLHPIENVALGEASAEVPFRGGVGDASWAPGR